MRFDRDGDGAWMVDPGDLAKRFGISSGYLQRRMRLGQVICRVEVGIGDDEGRHRVTVRLDGSTWQAIFDGEGTEISECRW